MTPTPFQKLGAFVVESSNVSDQQLKAFADIGGRIVAPVTYGDLDSGPRNMQDLDRFKAHAKQYGIDVWGWGNGFGEDPQITAASLAGIVEGKQLQGAMYDLEAAYQWPGGNPNLLPEVAVRARELLGKKPIAITTNAMNASGIWNGRTLDPPRSMYDLGIRVYPQWYTWMYRANGAERPDANMRWLQRYGHVDPNFADKTGAQGRGLPLSYVHGALEVTGLEGSDLGDQLQWTLQAKMYGYTVGLWIYTLDSMPQSDFGILNSYRNRLYYV